MNAPATVRILLVDDDEDVRQSTAQALRLAGFEVQAFANVEAAHGQISPGAPVVVVSDVKNARGYVMPRFAASVSLLVCAVK